MKIALIANDYIGLQIAKFLKSQKENVVVLIIHKKESEFGRQLIKLLPSAQVFEMSSDSINNISKYLERIDPDIGICTWSKTIFNKKFLKSFKKGVVNLHNSFLPYGRGKYPQVWAINEGFPYGVSIHLMDESIDAGPLIAQKRIRIEIVDTGGSLYQRSLQTLFLLFKETWPKIKSGKINSRLQKGKATYYSSKMIDTLDYINLDKTYTGFELINQLRSRSFQDRSYAYFRHKGRRIYVKIDLSYKPIF